MGRQLDKVNPLIRERLEAEVERRLLSVYRSRQDFGWMGLTNDRPVNNWNPWIHSNLLTCALLLDGDPARRAQTVYKILTSLDRFLDSYHDDGGCDEGPGYWSRAGASLFECLDLLHSASGGGVNYFDLPLVRADRRVHLQGAHRGRLVRELRRCAGQGQARRQPALPLRQSHRRSRSAGASAHTSISRRVPGLESLGRALPALFQGAEIRKAEARDPLVRDAWLAGHSGRDSTAAAGTATASTSRRSADTTRRATITTTWAISSCTLNGNPVLIDVGVETYTAKTFSSETVRDLDDAVGLSQSAHHQRRDAGRGTAVRGARRELPGDEQAAEFAADLAAAYPKEAGVEKWRRSVRLDRAANAFW